MDYKIISDMVAGKPNGETLTEKELEGANIEALISAGHLQEINSTQKKED